MDRREFVKLAGLGGVVFASGLPGYAHAQKPEDFFFVQLTDTHWGYKNDSVNPEAGQTLKRLVAAVNGLALQPDFVMFTGDLTQTTDDPKVRRQRLAEFREQVAPLKAPARLMAGEHDASLDGGEAYKELFGELYYTFDHKGVHFIVIDNISDRAPIIGEKQLGWLRTHLAPRDRNERIVVLTHRPLFDLYPQWDWATRDGAQAIELLMPFRNVTVFYGHIHQEHHHLTGHIGHHAAMSAMFPLAPVGTMPKKTQTAWDPTAPLKGLGWRTVKSVDGFMQMNDIPLRG